jgi:Flp pilus assembly protein TadB
MGPFGWKNSSVWLIFAPTIIALSFALGIGLWHDPLSAVLCTAILCGLIWFYIRRKRETSKKR